VKSLFKLCSDLCIITKKCEIPDIQVIILSNLKVRNVLGLYHLEAVVVGLQCPDKVNIYHDLAFAVWYLIRNEHDSCIFSSFIYLFFLSVTVATCAPAPDENSAH